MKNKRIMSAGVALALCAALLCSGLVFSNAENAYAKAATGETGPYIIEYKQGEMKHVPEVNETQLEKQQKILEYIEKFDYSDSYIVEYPLEDTGFNVVKSEVSSKVHELVETKGGTVPTSFWNLSNGAYQFAMVNIRNYVYTDYYFNVDAEDCIAMSMGTLDSDGADMRISLCEVGSNNVVQQWTGNPESILGLGFCNLNQYKNYYVKFEAYQADSVSGSGYIMHD